jgi:molybdopterin-guanine dinucleotide biosynthesis protein MobB
MIVCGIIGWKDSGKTTLTERLVAECTGRGLRVSTVKGTHHDAEVDQPGRDSFRHRTAGAHQVILAGPERWALMTEARGAARPGLADLLAHLDPVDLVLVEGFKSAPHPKIEVHRPQIGQTGQTGQAGQAGAARPLLAPGDRTIRAVACKTALAGLAVPQFDPDDISGIANFILTGIAR